MARTCVLWQ